MEIPQRPTMERNIESALNMSLGSENPCVPNQMEVADEATFDDTRVDEDNRMGS